MPAANQNPLSGNGLSGAFASAIREHWVLFLVEGIVLIVLGVLAIMVPMAATLATTIFLGWLFLVSGIVGLVTTFMARNMPGFWWSLLSAVLAVVAGLILVSRPVEGIFTLTLVLIAYFVVDGVSSIMMALQHRRDGTANWAWLLVSGVVTLILAAIILFGLPGTAIWVIGLLVGIDLLMGGAALAALALAARNSTPPTVHTA